MSSSDFSTFALFTAGLAIFAPLVSGQKTLKDVPGYPAEPTGPSVNEPGFDVKSVTAGTSTTVKWAVTEACGKTVDLVLLSGSSPATLEKRNFITNNIPNSGSYEWTPLASNPPTTESGDIQVYGIELVCQDYKTFQYTSPFKYANEKYSAGGSGSGSSSSSSKPSAAPSSYPSGSSPAPYPGEGSGHNSSTTTTSSSSSAHSHPSETPKYPTVTGGAGYSNNTQPKPTGSLTVPSTISTTTSVSVPTGTRTSSSSSATAPASTGSAMNLKAGLSGLVAAAGVAVFAL